MNEGPKKRVNGKYYKVSRLVMEGVVGRKLYSNEDVHHKDGNPWNNSPGNLQLLSHADHTRVSRTGQVMSEEARRKIGMNGWNRVLSPEDIPVIRKMIEGGVRYFLISFVYGIKKAAICEIKMRRNWGWVA